MPCFKQKSLAVNPIPFQKETIVDTTVVTTKDGHRLELINLLDPGLNKLYNMDLNAASELLKSGRLNDINGEFALAAFVESEQWGTALAGARTIGVPARIACQLVSPNHSRFIVGHTIGEIREAWERYLATGNGGSKPFDPGYTMMFPAFHRVTIKPWAMQDRKYDWFLDQPAYGPRPESELLPPDAAAIGIAYVRAMQSVVANQLDLIPDGVPVGMSLSGGADSASVATVLLAKIRELGRNNRVHLVTLAIGGTVSRFGGTDFNQAKQVAEIFDSHFDRSRFSFHPLWIAPSSINTHELMGESAGVLEEYHIRDVECGMAGLLLGDGIRQKITGEIVPPIQFDFNGDGGNEIFRDYPLADEGYGNISFDDVLAQPFLYLLGYPRQKLAFNPVFSAGLSRAYTRTFNPARKFGVRTFSPLIDRRVIDVGRRIPLARLAPNPQALHVLRGEAVRSGIKSILGIDLPVFPKARFQEGCAADPRFLRVTQEDQRLLKAMVLGRA